MVRMLSSGRSRVPSKLRRKENVRGVGWWLRRRYFIPESDSLEVQPLLVAVGRHQLPEGCLLLDFEAKKEREE